MGGKVWATTNKQEAREPLFPAMFQVRRPLPTLVKGRVAGWGWWQRWEGDGNILEKH